jgi:hypothetical protein
MLRAFCVVSVALVLAATGVVAQAGYVPLLKNMDTGLSILEDNFESYALHVAPNNAGPAAATWGTPGNATGGNAVGIWPNNYGALTGGEGAQCLLLDRGSEDPGCWITGYGDAARSGNDETVKATMLFYNFNVETSVYLQQGDTELLQVLLYGGAGTDPGHVRVYNTELVDTGLTFAGDATPAFSKLEITHVNGTNAWDISVDGSAPVSVAGYAAGNVDAIKFKCDGPHSTGLFDAVAEVPEPSTFALLASGFMGLLAYAWRNRK